MVTRKPLPDNAKPLPDNAKPLSPGSTQMPSSRDDPWSPADPSSPWDDAPRSQQRPSDIPDALRPGGGNYTTSAATPSVYVPPQIAQDEHVWDDAPAYASPAYVPPNAPSYASPAYVPPSAPVQTVQYTGASDSQRLGDDLGGAETNPFKRKGLSQNSSRSASQHNQTPPTGAFGEMNLNSESPANPWQPDAGLDPRSAATPSPAPPLPPPFPSNIGPGPEGDPWRADHPIQQQRPASPDRQSISSGRASPAWDDLPENQTKASQKPQQMSQDTEREINEDRHAWDDGLVQDKGKNKENAPAAAQQAATEGPLDNWSLIDPAAGPKPPVDNKGKVPELLVDFEGASEEAAPALPPRPRYLPRPVDSKSETYQIKKINWHDHRAAQNPRTSPILVQNENGPCPLVALVNALTLTTPAETTDTSLIEVLKSREQISLGLLLDAVFDELMSPRRTVEDTPLPDVGELYDFMKGLHTGMNVNPRFVPSSNVVEAFKRTSLTHLHPVERGDMIPGTFEDTVEMELYSAFSIPLIHGWLPTKDDPAFDALTRRATSYDQAQTLLFHEEELEAKLSRPDGDALTEDEQQLYQDIITIRSFLESSATQLTTWGLEVIQKAMRPGLFAILFRNDHFSTLYRHPETNQLLALVTDAGYANHGDVVWESLTDVSGVNTEYLSGNFKLVSGAGAQQGGPRSPEWFEEGAKSSKAGSSGEAQWSGPEAGSSSRGHKSQLSDADRVQEDHDLALAMQMQEEEDERHRAEQAKRKRERELSEQFIEQQARQSGPSNSVPVRGTSQATRGARRPSQGQSSLVSPRVSSSTLHPTTSAPLGRRQSAQSTSSQQVRPLVPPVIPQRRQGVNRAADEGTDDAPPTYEQAQNSTPYVPPPGHPSHPATGTQDAQAQAQGQTEGVTGQGMPQQGRGQYPDMSGPGSNARWGTTRPPHMGGMGRGRPVAAGMQGGRDRDCSLM